MKSRHGMFFICGIRYEKVMEDGFSKKITEQYVVEALSFTEAEERITEEMKAYISGDFEVKRCAVAPFNEVVFSDDTAADKWYKTKLDYITIDERTEKEKRTHVLYLVQANSIKDALANMEKFMSKSVMDYSIVSMQETPYINVFEYSAKEV